MYDAKVCDADADVVGNQLVAWSVISVVSLCNRRIEPSPSACSCLDTAAAQFTTWGSRSHSIQCSTDSAVTIMSVKRPARPSGSRRTTRGRAATETRSATGAPKRPSDGWLATRARTDEAHVTVYSLHVLQKRIQHVMRRARQGQPISAEDLENVRGAMLVLWHDAHRLTPPGVPLSYEEFKGQPRRRG